MTILNFDEREIVCPNHQSAVYYSSQQTHGKINVCLSKNNIEEIVECYAIDKSIDNIILPKLRMKLLEVRVFLILSVSDQFHVDCAKENIRAGYKATLLCSVSGH